MVSQRKDETREAYLERCRKYYQEHKAERIAYRRKYYQEHKKEISIHDREYYQNHPEVQAKHNAKRRRHLGYVPINKHFDGSHGHHVDKDRAVYIPADLHRSVYHNVFTGQGMAEINTLVSDWINEHTRR